MGIGNINAAAPLDRADAKYGASELRTLKADIDASFPNLTPGNDVVTKTAAEINNLVDATANNVALALKANLASPTFTGTVTVATVNAAPGNQTAPSYTFTGDADTGIYSGGTGVLGITTDGVKRATVNVQGLALTKTVSEWTGLTLTNSTGDRRGILSLDNDTGTISLTPLTGSGAGTSGNPILAYDPSPGTVNFYHCIRHSDGGAVAPAYSFRSLAGSGMYATAGGLLGLAHAGAEKLAVAASVISTTVPVHALHAGSAAAVSIGVGDDNSGFWRNAPGQIGMSLDGANYFTFTGAGLTGPTTAVSSDDAQYASNHGVLDAIKKISSFASLTNAIETLTASGSASEIGGWTLGPSAYSEVAAATNGQLTAATTGTYRVEVLGYLIPGGLDYVSIEVRVNGASLSPRVYAFAPIQVVGTDQPTVSASVLLNLNATQYVSLYRENNTLANFTLSSTRMSLQRVA